MSIVTDTIRAEFRSLLPQVEAIRNAAEELDEASLTEMRHVVDQTIDFVNGTLVPRATLEATAVYPAIDRLYGGVPASAVMAHEHREIITLVWHLGSIQKLLDGPITSPGQLKLIRRDLTRILYSLYALTRSHIVKEDEVYLPLLEHSLSPAEPGDLIDRKGYAAADTRARAA